LINKFKGKTIYFYNIIKLKGKMFYKNIDLSSNEIKCLILGGGGTTGFVYLGLIKCLQEKGFLDTIDKYYGVSAGSIIVLLLNLGYTYDELLTILLDDIKYDELIKITGKSILNLFDKFSLADSTYLEELLKNLIEKKGYNPYINFRQLYDITKKELNIGFVKCFQNKYVNANHITRSEMPIWLAVRASCSIPFIFQPVIDATNGFDLLIDGCILKDNNISSYLETIINDPNSKIINNLLDKSSQTYFNNLEEDNLDNLEEDNLDNLEEDNLDNLEEDKFMYNHNFICVILDTGLTNDGILYDNINDLNKVNFKEFLFSIVKKIFYNQDTNKKKYADFILKIPCRNYNIEFSNVNIDKSKMIDIINHSYKFVCNYIDKKLKKQNTISDNYHVN
jgi:NTE family protein